MKMSFLKRYLVFIFGLYLLAGGVVLIVRSSLGTTPISSFNYVCSLNTPLSLGTWTFLLNMMLIIGQYMLVKGHGSRRDFLEISLQIPFSLLFGIFIDINMHLTSWLVPGGYAGSLAILAAGCIVQAFGVALELKPDVAVMSAEGFVKYAARRCHRNFGSVKLVFDFFLVSLAAVTSWLFCGRIDGIREGTIVAASTTGLLVTLLFRLFHWNK